MNNTINFSVRTTSRGVLEEAKQNSIKPCYKDGIYTIDNTISAIDNTISGTNYPVLINDHICILGSNGKDIIFGSCLEPGQESRINIKYVIVPDSETDGNLQMLLIPPHVERVYFKIKTQPQRNFAKRTLTVYNAIFGDNNESEYIEELRNYESTGIIPIPIQIAGPMIISNY